ncbi:hypothetical protein BaRGS_00011714 [Batillaria attramentaria]|uniref:Uncharacterized protein n=1 Tax=Batillaria attramentaria TaxID=370345 RepID=A0ABD0LCF1_9CAEN
MTTVSRTRRVPSSTASRPTQPAVTTGEAAPVTERPGQPAAAPHSGEIYVHREVILDQQNNMADQTPPSDTINTAPAVSAAPSVLILLLAIIWQAA